MKDEDALTIFLLSFSGLLPRNVSLKVTEENQITKTPYIQDSSPVAFWVIEPDPWGPFTADVGSQPFR